MPHLDRPAAAAVGQDTAWSDAAETRQLDAAKPVTVHTAALTARAEHLCAQSDALIQRADRLIAASSRRLGAVPTDDRTNAGRGHRHRAGGARRDGGSAAAPR
jgi:hypothetical protein